MSKTNLKIKKMTKEDLDSVMEIEALAYGDHHWSKDSFYSEISNTIAHYFCAFDENDKLLGYIGTWIIIDESHITNLAVHPDYQGKKVGESLLVTALENCYKNMAKYLTLEVRVSNIPAKNLYEKYLFKSLGVRKGYYQDNNEDALIMWTENIFWDKFKEQFKINTNNLKEKINIL